MKTTGRDKMEKSKSDLESIVQKRGWSIKEDDPAREKRRRRAYERAVENLEANTEPVSLKALQSNEKPKALLQQIIRIQNHLDQRFSAKKGGAAAFYYGLQKAAYSLAGHLSNGRIDCSVYKKSDIELISEQRLFTNLLLGEFKQSGSEMRKSYELLQEYRLETARDLQKGTRKYMRLERELSELERDEQVLKEQVSRTTADKRDYAELIHATGNVKLERQKLVNEHEKAASSIKSARIGLDEIADYQMVIRESEQVLGDASNSLEQVSTQQAIAQAVLSAFVEGETSMGAAYEVMQTLSTNIVTTHRTITGTFDALNKFAVQLSARKVDANTTTQESRGLYRNMRDSRKAMVEDVHNYVRRLFEKPLLEVGEVSSNGHYAVEAVAE